MRSARFYLKRLKNPNPSAKSPIYYALLPIDHGLSFPDCFETCNYEIVWMDWPQVKEPLSKKSLEFLDSIDPKKDLELLCTKLGLRKKCLQNFYLIEILLKTAAKKGFNLYEIGNMIYKDDEDDEKPTDIKRLLEKTEHIYQIIKAGHNKTLDKWVRRSINIIKQKSLKKELIRQKIVMQTVLEQAILEDEEEETKKSCEFSGKRRRSFSDKLLEEETLLINNSLYPNVYQQSPDSYSNSTEDDLYKDSLKLNKKTSMKFLKNEVKIKQKSPEMLSMKRSVSLPYLKRNDSNKMKNGEEMGENFLLEKGTLKKKRKAKKKLVKNLKPEDIYDDMFIYYYESFLNQLLDQKLKEKNRAKNVFRNRVSSSSESSFK